MTAMLGLVDGASELGAREGFLAATRQEVDADGPHSAAAAASRVCRIRLAPQLGDEPCRLDRDPPVHLRAAVLAVVEGDWNLVHAKAGAQRPVGQLDLEGVPA